MEMIKYPKMKRESAAIIEEKLDGSNFSWEKTDGIIHFYSRNKEVFLEHNNDKFYHQFINKITDIDLVVPFAENYVWYAEVLGQTPTKYNSEENLFVFDIYSTTNNRFQKRDLMVENCTNQGLSPVPTTELMSTASKIDPSIQREGIVLRYEYNFGTFKVKHLESEKALKNPAFDIWEFSEVKKATHKPIKKMTKEDLELFFNKEKLEKDREAVMSNPQIIHTLELLSKE